MIMDLPIFFPDDKRYAEEARKGINLRFLNANNKELGYISRMAVPGKAEDVKAFCGDDSEIHIGVGLFGSEDIKKLGNLNNFLLFAPLASADELENAYQLILSEWEAKAIKRYLNYCEIISNEVKIVTNFDVNSSYVKPFENIFDISSIKVNNEIKCQIADTTAIILIAEKKWRVLRKLRSDGALKKKIVITTSSIEDWHVPPPIRKMFAKWVVYTYPRLAENSKNIINRFEQEFEYKPSVYSLLAYDATDIAMKTLINAGPGYEAMRKYLEITEFDTITMGKIGFGEKNNPYLIGRDSETLFDIKHVDSKGRYRDG